jgi:TPR repeat protein
MRRLRLGAWIVLAVSASPAVALAQEAMVDAQACYAGRYDRCAYAGDAYHEGTGVPVSYDMAAQLYRFGCDRGDMRSCRAMGWIHQQQPGHGVPTSLSEAHRYYQLGCNGGYALACYDLGTLYWTGEGVPESWPIGQSYYERACSMRHADACREVAYIYGRAMGVPRDFARMGALLRQACDLGNQTACQEMLDPAGAAMRADQDGSGGAAQPQPQVVQGMPDAQFQDLVLRFRRDSRTASQLALARDLATGGVQLSCAQIASVMQTSGIDSTRVQLGLTLWPRALDPQNFYLLPQALEYEGSRTLLRQQTGH